MISRGCVTVGVNMELLHGTGFPWGTFSMVVLGTLYILYRLRRYRREKKM
jgi:hypothetical protein